MSELNINAVSHSFLNSGYKISTDYNLLYDLIFKGIRIPAWLLYSKDGDPIWDLVEVKVRESGKIGIGTRGIGYEPIKQDFDSFEKNCKMFDLHFILPKNCG